MRAYDALVVCTKRAEPDSSLDLVFSPSSLDFLIPRPPSTCFPSTGDCSILPALYAISLISPTLIAGFGTYTRAESQLMTLPIYVTAWCVSSLFSRASGHS